MNQLQGCLFNAPQVIDGYSQPPKCAKAPARTRPLPGSSLLRGTRITEPLPSAPSRVQGLQLHHELDRTRLPASTDLNDGRACRRAWQQRLNAQIQQLTLHLLVSIFRYFKHSQCLSEGPEPTCRSLTAAAPRAQETETPRALQERRQLEVPPHVGGGAVRPDFAHLPACWVIISKVTF